MARAKKTSKAKKHAEVEILRFLGTDIRFSPTGLQLYAEDFLRAAQSLPAPQERFKPARYFLLCRTIELSLKAFLSVRLIPLATLAEGAFGHDLDALLRRAEGLNLQEYVSFSDQERSEIRAASKYYQEKVLEYPSLSEAVVAYPSLPDAAVLLTAAVRLVDGLARPCREAQ